MATHRGKPSPCAQPSRRELRATKLGQLEQRFAVESVATTSATEYSTPWTRPSKNCAFTDFTDFYATYCLSAQIRLFGSPGTGSAKTDHARKSELNESLRAALNVFADPRFLFHGC